MRHIIKRNGQVVPFNFDKIEQSIAAAYASLRIPIDIDIYADIEDDIDELFNQTQTTCINVDTIQDHIEKILIKYNFDVAKSYILYREKHKNARNYVLKSNEFINNYKSASNTANATIDDNANVANKNVGILNSELHKQDNILISRARVTDKLKELFPNFDSKQYVTDLENHIIYKHDESSAPAIYPYCASISMYPFLRNGLRTIGGLSAYPKNLDSFCGMYINLIFATSAMLAGAVATSEFLVYFDYFARKEWGDDYYKNTSKEINQNTSRAKTIQSQIHQYFQQVVYSINQPAAARGLQSAFVNFSYFDKPFFESMFGNFVFPDNTKPIWESLNWLQRDFMKWFNEERLHCMITFPVESFALIYKDGKFVDEDSARFVAEEWARGHSFFCYISDTADSLSSCCRLKNVITTHEFNFTNGNMGIETGSVSVMTLNINRILQNFIRDEYDGDENDRDYVYISFKEYLHNILNRVYKYQIAYGELMWDMYNAGLLPVYSAGFISLNNQYLTIGINGLNQAAEFLGIKCSDNDEYKHFCQFLFSTIKEYNSPTSLQRSLSGASVDVKFTPNSVYFNKHKIMFNTECVPAESLAVKNYNWDKADGYWVPNDTNLYASYIFKPNEDLSVLEKIRMHGREYIGEYLDGGSAAHLNLDSHLSSEQYYKLMRYAAEQGCSYFTWNIPNSECQDCGYITKTPITKCPKCGSTNVALWDRVIGYLSKMKNWSHSRQIEQKSRIYKHIEPSEQ